MESPLRARHGLAHNSSSVASNTQDDRGDGNGENYTFKVVTTKRSLLLCAPSEEEEIRWLSTVRALIARRSGRTEMASGGSPQQPINPNHPPPPPPILPPILPSSQQQQQQQRRRASVTGE